MFIYDLSQKFNKRSDVHGKNIMWRPGLYYPQLVITDPLF